MVTRIEGEEGEEEKKGRTDNNQGKEARKRDGTLFL